MKSMFEYSKIILEKVSFSKELFRKEHQKFHQVLTPVERQRLKTWIRRSGYRYSE